MPGVNGGCGGGGKGQLQQVAKVWELSIENNYHIFVPWPQQHNNLLHIQQLVDCLPFQTYLHMKPQIAVAVCGQDCPSLVHYGHQDCATCLKCSSDMMLFLQFNT